MEAEIPTVRLQVRTDNSGTRSLYEKLGFQMIRRIQGYYADGATALEYCAPLAVVLRRMST